MTVYRVNVGPEAYEGDYGSLPDAVYGALLKLTKDYASGSPAYPGRDAGPSAIQQWRAERHAHDQAHPFRDGITIDVRSLGRPQRGQRHKARKVNP